MNTSPPDCCPVCNQRVSVDPYAFDPDLPIIWLCGPCLMDIVMGRRNGILEAEQ